MLIDHLFVMRVGEFESDALTRRGIAQVTFIAQEIEEILRGRGLPKSNVVVLCSGEEVMREAANIVGRILDIRSSQRQELHEWVSLNAQKISEDHLRLIHIGVLSKAQQVVMAILPKEAAEGYPLHFMLTEKVGAPNPRIRNRLEPGEAVQVHCEYGRRETMSLPGNSAIEQIFGGIPSGVRD